MTRSPQSARAIALLLLTGAGALYGQAHRSIILGQVTDPTGAAVGDAEVRVIQSATAVVRATRTNASGHYEVPGLFPGTYRVEASHPGFKTAVINSIEVTSGRTVEVDLTAEIGEVKESVTVTADKELLDTANADVNTVIGARSVADLPLGQGHAAYLFLMVPGADSASSAGRGGSGMDIQPIQRQGTSQTRFDGSPQGTTEYTLDGTPNTQRGNSLPGGGEAFNPSTEVTQEVRVQTSTFDASVGHTGGATVDLVLKAGTNQYHGNAVGFVRDPSWNANAWSANRAGVARPDFTYRRWGFSGGGPVWLGPVYKGKDRTFFYYGYEKWSSLSPNPATFITVPRAEQLNGDFSALLRLGQQYQLWDPDTARPAANGRIQRSPFPNNIIPSARISPVAKAFSKLWPTPNAAGTADGLLNFGYNNAPLPRRFWASTLRVDHSINNSNKLFGRWIVSDSGIPFDNLFGRTDIPEINLTGRNRDAAISDVWMINPSFIADFRASEMRFHWLSTPIGLGIPYQDYGLEALSGLLDTTRTGFPNIVIAGYAGFNNSAGSRDISEIRNLSAHFTKIRGNHGFKFGADIRWYIDNRGTEDLVRIDFPGAFSNGPLDNSPAPPIGVGLSDFLLGRFSQISVNQPSKAANLTTYQGLYFQDDWKISRRLTLNLGIRWEREGPPTERFNRSLAGFDFNTDNPIAAQAKAAYGRATIPEISANAFQVRGGVLFAGTGGNARGAYRPDNNNFAPRMGLAFQANRNTVLRAGYGIYYVPYGQRFFANEGGVPGFDVSTTALSSPDSGLTFNRSLANPFPEGLNKPTGTTAGLATFLGQNLNLRAFGDNANAYTQRWLFSIQQRLGSNFRLEARYVGSHTLKMPIQRNLNALPNSYLSTSPVRDANVINNLTLPVTNPFFGLPGVAGAIGTSRTIAKSNLLRPYPQFGNINYFNHQGWSEYNALQVEFQRSFSNGLLLQSSFTWSKTMDALDFLNEGDPTPERVISAADRPYIWRFLALYELPFAKGRRWGGWQIQGITFLESGIPLAWGNALFRGNIKDIPVDHQIPERMFNVDAGFERNSQLQLANNLRTFPSRLSGARSSSETDTDLSLIKNTRIHERFLLQFRAEAYNVFNQHFFVNANTTPQNAAFGTTTSTSSPRAVQLGLKLVF